MLERTRETLEREGNERTRERKDGGNWRKIWDLQARRDVDRLEQVSVSTQMVRKAGKMGLSTGSDVVEPCQTDRHLAAIANDRWASSWHNICLYLATSALPNCSLFRPLVCLPRRHTSVSCYNAERLAMDSGH